jgi:hypothetical protein
MIKNSIPVLDVYILQQHMRWSYRDRERESRTAEGGAQELWAILVDSLGCWNDTYTCSVL